MTPEEWEELMGVEENHGRSRGEEGGWHHLDNSAAQSLEEHLKYIILVPVHGTRSTYVNEGCRCGPCKRAEREYRKQLRAKTSGMVGEPSRKEE